MPNVPRPWLKLRGKLTVTYLAVGLTVTLVNVWSTHWLQQRVEEVAADRAETVHLAEELAKLASGVFEEGFGYVLSGDTNEKDGCFQELAELRDLRERLSQRLDVRDTEAGVLARIDTSTQRATASAQRMFEDYDAARRVDPQSFEAYEAAMDGLTEEVHEFATGIRKHADLDNQLARERLHRVLLGVAGIAVLLALSMGAAFGLRLTRPLSRLRMAAARLGSGELDFPLGKPTLDEFGEVTGAFAEMAENIRRLLGTVADQKQHLVDVFASLGEMLIVCAPDGTITSVNRSACATLGYDEAELLGRGLDTLLDSGRFEALRERALNRDSGVETGVFEQDLRLCRKDGRYLAVSVSAAPLRTSMGDYTGLICVAQDLSDRRRLEAQLRQSEKLQAIGRLASGVAHEINTPVQFVNDSVRFARDAAADLARLIDKYQAGARALEAGAAPAAAFAGARDFERETDLPYLLERVPLALERSIQGLDRIAAIVRSMKVFAHPGQAEMTPVDLNQAVASTLTVAQNEYKYIADLATDFGELPLVTCYGGEINQAVLNLVINAAHAIAANAAAGVRGRIGVRTRRDGDAVVISISDNGTGIPEEIRDQIFDPFFTTKEVGKGTGQGLSVARAAIVETHRGELTFATECGKGTTFHIRLPIQRAEILDKPAKAAAAA